MFRSGNRARSRRLTGNWVYHFFGNKPGLIAASSFIPCAGLYRHIDAVGSPRTGGRGQPPNTYRTNVISRFGDFPNLHSEKCCVYSVLTRLRRSGTGSFSRKRDKGPLRRDQHSGKRSRAIKPGFDIQLRPQVFRTQRKGSLEWLQTMENSECRQ